MPTLRNTPHHIDQFNNPVFSLNLINLYGPPDAAEYDKYLVIDDEEQEIVCDILDWGKLNKRKLRPIHRYSRVERFRGILFNLLSLRGKVDEEVLELCVYCENWNDVRGVLKTNGLRRCYNLIPLIFQTVHGWKWVDGNIGGVLDDILHDFTIINWRFENEGFRKKWKRKYFPNLRFVAFKLMEMHGVFFEDTDYIRTERKKKVLDGFWNEIVY